MGSLKVANLSGIVLISRYTCGWRDALAKQPGPTAAELAPLLSIPQPPFGSAIGIAGLAVIIWLMTIKPF